MVTGSLADADLTDVSAVVVVLAAPGPDEDEAQPRLGTAETSARYGIDLSDLARRSHVTGKAGQAVVHHLPSVVTGVATWQDLPPTIVMLGIGSGSPADLRAAGAALARATRGLGTVVVGLTTAAEATTVTEGYLLASYRAPRLSSSEPSSAQRPAALLRVLVSDDAPASTAATTAAVAATWLARDLANTPSNIKNPEWVASVATQAATDAGLSVTVRDAAQLAEQGFGAILAVGAGSVSPPVLVEVGYHPAGATRHVALVGKGITYDTGGLSIKPRESMVPMKTDMTGSAVVLATVVAAAQLGLPVAVTALLPLAENHFGAGSYRPADVITTVGGTTVEVANTDAEGRLVLADALQHADLHLDPDVLIDVATLTGAATMALGRTHAALYATDDELADALLDAGETTGELLWRMPLVDEYESATASQIADLRHVAADSRMSAGSITAALFLRHFVGARRWAHLDIAGPARSTSDHGVITAGGTGFGARLLLQYLTALAG